MKRIIGLLLSVCMILTALPVYAAEKLGDARKINIFEIEGNTKNGVTVERGAKKTFNGAEGTNLGQGDNVTTDTKTTARLQIDGDKVLIMSKSSGLSITKASDKKLDLSHTAGEVYFALKNPLSADSQMSLASSGSIMGVRGTTGLLSKIGNKTKLIVFSGTVTVSSLKSNLTVSAGNYCNLASDGSLSQVMPVKINDLTSFALKILKEVKNSSPETENETNAKEAAIKLIDISDTDFDDLIKEKEDSETKAATTLATTIGKRLVSYGNTTTGNVTSSTRGSGGGGGSSTGGGTTSGAGWTISNFVDPRFEVGYPKANLRTDTSGNTVLDLTVKMRGANLSNPMELFMVNDYNGYNFTVDSVIDGHVANNGGSYYAPRFTPFLMVEDNYEHTVTLNTGTLYQTIAYFVVKDNYSTSTDLTYLKYTATSTGGGGGTGPVGPPADTYPPYFMTGYVNSTLDKVYLYFDETLNPANVPSSTYFTFNNTAGDSISAGSGISIVNYDSYDIGVVVIPVTGLTNATNLTFSYNGLALRDRAGNLVRTLTGETIDEALVDWNPTASIISINSQYIKVETTNPIFFLDGTATKTNLPITLKYGSSLATAVTVSDFDYNMSFYFDRIDIYIRRTAAPATVGDNYYVTLNPASTVKDFALESISLTPDLEVLASTSTETATVDSVIYYEASKNLVITYQSGHSLNSYNIASCLFNVTADGKTYVFRGNFRFTNNRIVISGDHFPFDPTKINWAAATIKYSALRHDDIRNNYRLMYQSGLPYDEFGVQTVTVNPGTSPFMITDDKPDRSLIPYFMEY